MKNQPLNLSQGLNTTVSVLCFAFFLIFANQISAQNVGVNTTTPNASAMLDVVSTNSGILVPRLTMVQRNAIALPATSLLIYQTDNTPGYYYNSGTPTSPVWIRLFSGAITGGEWTDAGIYLNPNENPNARVYEDNALYGFYYEGAAESPGYFNNTVASVDNQGVLGICDNTTGYGYGGMFFGGYCGAAAMGDDIGIEGMVDKQTGFGVYALNLNTSGTGLIARGNNQAGSYLTGGSGIAAIGTNTGIYGTATAAKSSAIYGILNVADGFGVFGKNENAAGTGVIGVGNNKTANFLPTGTGGAFTGNSGALGSAAITTGTGLIGIGNNLSSISTLTNGSGVAGNSTNVGVYGWADATASSTGVYGTSDAVDGSGVIGVVASSDAVGVYGECGAGGAGWGGLFADNLGALGDIFGLTKNFLIDNPENPENELLRHTCIESPEALVMYRGKITLNANGEATVEMPSYFKALTKENEATVQITCIGKPFGIGYEWNNNFGEFVVYGEANREISWMVMADRDDPYMQNNRTPVVIKKDGSFKGIEQGVYLDAKSYNQAEEKSYRYQIIGKKIETKTTQLQSMDKGSETLKEQNILNEIKRQDKKYKLKK